REVSRKWKIILIVLIAVGGYLLLNTSIGSSLLEKNRTLIDNGDISNGRFFLFEEMFKIFVSRPITGIGPLSTFSYYNDYLGHNVYLQVLCEMGVIGFVALLYMLISGLKYRINVLKRKNATDFDFLALFIQLFIIIYGFFGNPIFSYVFIIPYILFSAD
ncbi:O-antigen ligase family protein, partial [Thomasclavelia spiroformis]|uniref:O-antigen ligase family protein n=1 Tax=Thomasclavelia spiroformis TaxID=29348 RepID=UPI0029423B7B